MTTGSSWYSLHRHSCYPLLPRATGRDDLGQPLPHELLCDLRLRFAGDENEVAYISAAEVSAAGVTLLFRAQDRLLGAVTAPLSELQQGRQIFRIVPIDPETQGFAVISLRSDTPRQRYKFSGPEQSGLLARAATPFASARRTARLVREGFVPLVGPVIYLRGEEDISITRERRLLDNEIQDAVILRLQSSGTRTSATEIRNPATTYRVGCGDRPESLTCGDPVPLQQLDGVPPDCCGRVYVELRGCGELQPRDDGHGAVLVCDSQVESLCPPPALPDAEGRLPGTPTPEEDCVQNRPQTN